MSYLSQDTLSPTEKVLLEPYLYLTQNPGKEIRSKLVEAFGIWLQVPDDKLRVIREVVEMLHTASLLIDDVEDDSLLRRGQPVAHKIFGVPSTINCANYVYFIALSKLLTLNSPDCVKIFTDELLQLHRGQGMEIHWRDTAQCPTEEEYLEMVQNKTGGLLRLAIKLMMSCANCQVDYVPLVNLIGAHYQIRDDYLNLRSDNYIKNKGFAEDLTEGKFSFPVIHCIRSSVSPSTSTTDIPSSIAAHSQSSIASQLMSILRQRPTDPSLKSFAIQLMHKTDTFEYCRTYLKRVEQLAREEICRLGGNKQLEGYLDFLARDYQDSRDPEYMASQGST
ncbi:isoprenoid synthase domain-containing protein [Gaertneriomyces semiglobifer]|nr:isoprenoid synthase domain-containing protein [Gaertneriomyces semiglobifer]